MSEQTGSNLAIENNQVANQNGAPPDGADAQVQAARQPTRMQSFLGVLKSLIIRALMIYFVSSFFRGSKPTQLANKTSPAGPNFQARNIFPEGTPLSLYIYLSESDEIQDFNHTKLFWVKDEIIYGDWTAGPNGDGIFEIEKDVPVTDQMRNNGSLYLHAFLTRMGRSPDPSSKHYNAEEVVYTFKQLNRYKKLKSSNTKNLLTGETEQVPVEDGKVVSHWHSNITINLVTDQTLWTVGTVPAPLDQYVKFTNDFMGYKPILYPNDYWNMARDYKPLNETYTLRLTFQPISLFKWQLYAAQAMKNSMWGNLLGDTESQDTDKEQDTIKETLMDTNPYLLGMTIVVSMMHSIFELLAFKNDIQFWNKRDSLEGLSVRSVFFGVIQSLIVLLYVLDNETNFVIKISCFLGLGIEMWKIWKVVDIKFENGRIVFKDKGSYVESSTKVYDELAFKYLSWVCFPLLAGYCCYALLYMEHKGWYSFILDILYGFLLTFGFIMMTPQLFINYKLKSVAHLPWRMLTYKFFNTFIDDMFAFVIKMPTMYRIGCFRDDIVFLIFLYQRWIYPVDKTRRNEFGYSAEQQEEQKTVTNGEAAAIPAISEPEESKKDQ